MLLQKRTRLGAEERFPLQRIPQAAQAQYVVVKAFSEKRCPCCACASFRIFIRISLPRAYTP